MIIKNDIFIQQNKNANRNKIIKLEDNNFILKRLNILLSFLTKKGKKHLMENALRNAFSQLGSQINVGKIEFLFLVFNNITPLINLFRRGSLSRFREKTFISVLDLTFKKIKRSSVWLAKGIKAQSAHSIGEKICNELLLASEKKGFSYNKLKKFYLLAKEQQNKTIYYRKKKVTINSPKKQGFNPKKQGYVYKKINARGQEVFFIQKTKRIKK